MSSEISRDTIELALADSPTPDRVLSNTRAPSLAKSILTLTWPVVLGQLMANMVPVIDLLMLGRFGTLTLAAVGYAAQFLMLVQATLLAIGAACVALMARAIGANDLPRARQAFAASLWVALGVTGTFAAIAVMFPRELLHLLAVKESVVHLAVPYMRLTLTAAPLMAVAFTFEHAFRSARDTFVPMLIAAITALVKIGTNCLLLFGLFGLPKLGLVGAGVATLVSQLVAALLFWRASRKHRSSAVRLQFRDLRVPAERVREAFRVAWPAIIERFVMNSAMLVYFRFLGGYGVEAIAAYNVGIRILAFTWIPGLGLAVAAATLVGHALGAGDPALARRAGAMSMRLGVAVSLVLCALFIAFRLPIARAFTDDAAVVAALDPFILLLGIALPFLVTHFTLSGALRGAGDTWTPLWAAAFGTWGVRVPLGYLCAQLLSLPLFWVWAIMIVDHMTRATWLVWSFYGSDWTAKLGATVRADEAAESVASAA